LNLKSKKSYRVAKYLLTKGTCSQTEISKETGVAIGYINEIIHNLSDLNIVKIGYGETTLIDYARLLEKISMDRPFKELVTDTFRLPTSSITETENTLKRFCVNNKINHAFTGFSALRRFYEYHISYPTVHIYINNKNNLSTLEKGEGVIPVIVLNPDRQDILANKNTEHDTNICEKIQVIIDLFSMGTGRDAAINYYRGTLWKPSTY